MPIAELLHFLCSSQFARLFRIAFLLINDWLFCILRHFEDTDGLNWWRWINSAASFLHVDGELSLYLLQKNRSLLRRFEPISRLEWGPAERFSRRSEDDARPRSRLWPTVSLKLSCVLLWAANTLVFLQLDRAANRATIYRLHLIVLKQLDLVSWERALDASVPDASSVWKNAQTRSFDYWSFAFFNSLLAACSVRVGQLWLAMTHSQLRTFVCQAVLSCCMVPKLIALK